MNWFWFFAGAGFALLNIYALWRKKRILEGVAKSATMLFLIIGLITTGFNIDAYPPSLIYFIAGAVFCLIGDILLWLPPEKYFQAGLIAFLFGHIGYILGFGWVSNSGNQLVPLIILFVLLAIVGFQISFKIINALRKAKRDRLVIPIAVYSLVISVMLFLAGIRLMDENWSVLSAILAAFGAFSFFTSDVLNAWTRFVAKLPNDRIIIMGLYHIGQFSIAIGILTHYVA